MAPTWLVRGRKVVKSLDSLLSRAVNVQRGNPSVLFILGFGGMYSTDSRVALCSRLSAERSSSDFPLISPHPWPSVFFRPDYQR